MSDLIKCTKCERTFMNIKGLKTHERIHSNENNNNKLKDEKYIAKRIANTRSVQMHRQLNPKRKFNELENDTNQAINEAKIFENFIKEKLGLYFTSFEEKVKDYYE